MPKLFRCVSDLQRNNIIKCVFQQFFHSGLIWRSRVFLRKPPFVLRWNYSAQTKWNAICLLLTGQNVAGRIFYCLGSYFQQSINTLAYKPLCRLLLRQCFNTGWLYLCDCLLTYQYVFKNESLIHGFLTGQNPFCPSNLLLSLCPLVLLSSRLTVTMRKNISILCTSGFSLYLVSQLLWSLYVFSCFRVHI